ncbi:hypothetical protein HG441_000300 [Candidatus Saccharibacteria bacterium]|nr:hypothetical protein [Candidatus Saccharibacteria bacterium]
MPNHSETAILKVYVILRMRRQAKYGKQLVGHSGAKNCVNLDGDVRI